MLHLKKFLKVRDTHEAYAEVRGSGRVGIPMLQVGDDARLLDGEDTMLAALTAYPEWVKAAD